MSKDFYCHKCYDHFEEDDMIFDIHTEYGAILQYCDDCYDDDLEFSKGEKE